MKSANLKTRKIKPAPRGPLRLKNNPIDMHVQAATPSNKLLGELQKGLGDGPSLNFAETTRARNNVQF